MFEQHFGLTKRPFNGPAEGADVFIGPQTANLIGKAKKVFTYPDSAVCVSGPIGSGKTTLVGRTLSALERQHTIIRIGRIKLGPDEVLDYLLRELGLQQMPAGTIQKITVFRSILKKLEDSDIRLFVVVEDAERLGNVALQELEALTASDSGVSEGANLVLMSENPLRPAMQAPGLKRLEQRSRLHYALSPMNAAEVRGYVTHCLRQAGGNLSGILTDDAVLAVHALSEGISRVINNLLGSALESAADKGMQRLDAAELARIASVEFGIEVDASSAGMVTDSDTAEQDQSAEEPPTSEAPEPVVAAEPTPPAAAETSPAATADNPIPTGSPVPELIQDTMPEFAALDSGEHAIPDLIQDTLPGLDALVPEMPSAAELEAPPTVQPERGEVPDLPGMSDAPEIPELRAIADGPELHELDDAVAAGPVASSPAPDAGTAMNLPAADAPIGDHEIPELPIPELADDASLDDIPTLYESPADMETPDPASGDDSRPELQPVPSAEIPAWDRDPTLAELRPDLDALERAIGIAQRPDRKETPDPLEAATDKEAEVVPEITLDESIRRKIDVAGDALEETQTLEDEELGIETDINFDIEPIAQAAPAVEEPEMIELAEDLEPCTAEADAELDRIAAELAEATSISDVDDELAETLFGEEFNMLAAEVAANAPSAESDAEPVASPALELSGEPANDTSAGQFPDDVSQVQMGDSQQSPAHNEVSLPGSDTDLERKFKDLYNEDALEVSMETTPNGMLLSSSQRLAAVRALNAASPTGPGNGEKPGKPKPKPGSRPDSIEDQINTSLTQTLKGLDLDEIKEMQVAEAAEEEQKPGFFSRFRRS